MKVICVKFKDLCGPCCYEATNINGIMNEIQTFIENYVEDNEEFTCEIYTKEMKETDFYNLKEFEGY